jgi:hypothetical protein
MNPFVKKTYNKFIIIKASPVSFERSDSASIIYAIG